MTGTLSKGLWRCYYQSRPLLYGSKLKSRESIMKPLSSMMCSHTQEVQQNFSSISTSVSQRIFILGIGNLGRLFAHALASQPNPPPITLLFHRESLLKEWEQWKHAGRSIEIATKGVVSNSSGFDVELIVPGSGKKDQEEDSIHNLIITTKATQTIQALSSIAGRIHPSSTLVFAQNGMGVVQKVIDNLGSTNESFLVINSENDSQPTLPIPQPRYLTAIVSHGLYSTGSFSSVHAGQGNITLGQTSLFPRPTSKQTSQSVLSAINTSYLLNLILASPSLSATSVDPSELYHLQLSKLAANATINPLTALFGIKNGEILSHPPLVHLTRILLKEISDVFQSHLTLISTPTQSTLERFSLQSLETLVKEVARKTAENTSSMLQDVRAGRETEIEFINGWIVERGRELGMDVSVNEKVVRFVREGRRMELSDVENFK